MYIIDPSIILNYQLYFTEIIIVFWINLHSLRTAILLLKYSFSKDTLFRYTPSTQVNSANSIHLRAAEETKSRVKTLISHRFLYVLKWKKKQFFGIDVVYIKWIIRLSVSESGEYSLCRSTA